uniref:zinc finger CCCH domain-containing protein 10-like n=1 Tax=Pristiophorus japonicus TaxID=55135 RepID=UPI00398EC4DB
MPEKDGAFTSGGDTAGHSATNVCRDFLRNVCKRGKRCKYQHPELGEPGSEELPAGRGEVPVCRDHQNGDCQRGGSCKFRHLEPEGAGSLARFEPFGAGDLGDPLLKRRRAVESLRFDSYDYGVPRPFPVDYRYLEEENLMLRRRVEELHKQASNLMATNEMLLEQNAHYRCQPKVVTLAAAGEPRLTLPAVGDYNHTIVQAHNPLGGQPSLSRSELGGVPSAGAGPHPPASAAPGPHLTSELALAQTLAQTLATPVSMAPVTVSIAQPIPCLTMSHATTPMVSYAIASQSMRITPLPL